MICPLVIHLLGAISCGCDSIEQDSITNQLMRKLERREFRSGPWLSPSTGWIMTNEKGAQYRRDDLQFNAEPIIKLGAKT